MAKQPMYNIIWSKRLSRSLEDVVAQQLEQHLLRYQCSGCTLVADWALNQMGFPQPHQSNSTANEASARLSKCFPCTAGVRTIAPSSAQRGPTDPYGHMSQASRSHPSFRLAMLIGKGRYLAGQELDMLQNPWWDAPDQKDGCCRLVKELFESNGCINCLC